MTIIIGAGISGLLTALRLKQAGLPFRVLEARNRVGGRIKTLSNADGPPLEMGATWFGDQHVHLKALLQELRIESFEQFMEGTTFFQPFSNSPGESIQVPAQPPSYRIVGGSASLIRALYEKLENNSVYFNQVVKVIRFHKGGATVYAAEVFQADRVVMALPPKLWAQIISFSPPLPNDLKEIALQTQTWMEDSIKVALTYEHSFWQKENLSGTLFSNAGPITELYDHSNSQRSKYALCGFIHSEFGQLGHNQRKALVINQLKGVFGTEAESYSGYEECIWSEEEYTYAESESGHYPHQNNGNPIFTQSLYGGKLILASSETAPTYPGYMDGAVFSANEAAGKITTFSPPAVGN